MRHLRSLLPALLLLAPLSLAAAPAHDYERNEEHIFYIEQEEAGFSLSSKSDIHHRFLTERSTTVPGFSVAERYYDKITSLRGWLGSWRFELSDLPKHMNPAGDAFLSDATIRPISMETRPEIGDEIHYIYERKYLGIEYMPLLTIPSYNYLHEYSVTFEHPKDVKVGFEFFFPRGPVPYTVDESDPERTTLKFVNLEPSEELPGFSFNGIHAKVLVNITQGGKTISSTTPESFARWYFSQVPERPTLSPRFDTLLAAQLGRATAPAEKLRIIDDYVRANVRYIADEAAINAFVPRHPDTVLGHGYGDCKDRAYFVAAVARRYNLPVALTLVSTEQEATFKGTHLQLYNHMICAWKQGEKWIFIDPTAKYCEFGNLPHTDTETRALVLDPAAPQLVTIPPTGADTSISITLRANLADLKKGSARIVLRNSYKQAAQAAVDKLVGVEQENALSAMITTEFQKLSFDDIKVDTVTDDAVVCSAVADLSPFVIASPTRHYIPQLPFALPPSAMLDRARDTFQLALESPTSIALHIDLEAPSGTLQPLQTSFGDATGAFAASARQSGSTVRLDYRLNVPRRILPDREKQAFLSFCQKMMATKREMFIIAK